MLLRFPILALAVGCALAAAATEPSPPADLLFKVANTRLISLPDMVADLRTARIVLVGEQHDNRLHHQAQLTLIRTLVADGAEVAVGLEMFRADAQADLDAWVRGDLEVETFVRRYTDNWDTRYWPLYRDIFFYARRQGVPLVGLNVPRTVVQQVARRGFGSLDARQRRQLGVVRCNVSPKYADLLGRVLGFKEQQGPTFGRFCEAQVVWDTAMAKHAVRYAETHPNALVVILAGNFHAWKHGIPAQIEDFSKLPYRVVLPSSDSSFFRYDILLEDADYVWWHRSDSPPEEHP